MQRLLTSVGSPGAAKELDQSKTELMRTIFAEQSRQKRRSAAIEGNPIAGLKPWREVITPHQDVASGNYLQAEFAADLDQVHRKEATSEYQEPVEFFRRTYLTQGLSNLLQIALQRLTGQGVEPVVDLQTNFGGGKTHSMLALYHLFSGIPSTDLPGLEPLLEAAGVKTAPEARRAVLVGTALSLSSFIRSGGAGPKTSHILENLPVVERQERRKSVPGEVGGPDGVVDDRLKREAEHHEVALVALPVVLNPGVSPGASYIGQ